MNIFFHELRAYRKSTMVWTITLIAVISIFLFLYPSIYRDGETFKKVLAGLPESLRKAFGMTIDSLTSILGFYSTMFFYVLLCGATQAMILGTSIISKEIREKTADFLLTKPVARFNILSAKIAAIFTSIVITNIFFLISVSIIVPIVSMTTYNSRALFLISATLFFVQIMFMSLGILISVAAKKIKSVLALSLGTVCGFFIIRMILNLVVTPGNDKAMRYITPFGYFDYVYIIRHASYEVSYVVAGLIFVFIAIVLSYLIYSKKDIHAV